MMSQVLIHRIVLVLAMMLALAGRAPAAEALDLRLSPAWQSATQPLRRMPVQDMGFVRTGYTIADNYLSAIAGTHKAGGADAFEVMLYLMRDPVGAHDVQLIKLSHPELVRLFGSPRISLNQWHDESHRDALIALLKTDQQKWQKPLNEIEYRASLIENLDELFAIVPRADEWQTPTEAATSGNLDSLDRRIIDEWGKFRAALSADDTAAGEAAVRELAQAVTTASAQRGVSSRKLQLDYFYHNHQPFRNSATFYLFSALFYAAAMLLAKPRLNWVGLGLLSLGFVEQVIGVTVRWMLADRAPLSNMYESFTFAIGGMVLVALVLELTRSVKMAGLGASVLGFVFMVIAHKAPIFDSQIRPLMPALQSSWLTYHVVTIMLSYSAFALSFFVALVYLAKAWLLGGDAGTNLLARRLPDLDALDVFNYRIVAVGFPLLTLGIVFGAVWAATAWGRPWGFDPKETWSAITWLIYAIYLHVRFLSGWSGQRAAVFSVVGFLAVLFTYLGVNYLLPGLHSYV